MSYLALYRRYRPKTFDELIGQDHIVKTLVNQIENDRLGHAYLFTGTRGTGKTSCAKIFSKAINCLHPVNGSPCGECEACKALSDPSNIDVVEIDAASNNGVNEIRELRENVQFPPVAVKYKVYIIDEVHMLTGAAFNALLKTLEEPPKHAIFILATTEAHKIPATILSRCMRFDFRLIPTEKIAENIFAIYNEVGKKYEKEAVFAIAQNGEGSMRDALSIADIALSYNDGVLTYEDVMQVLGTSNFESISEFIINVLNGETGKVLECIDSLSKLGKGMGVLAKDITAFIRDLIVCKTCQNANSILNLPETKYLKYQDIIKNTTGERLLRILEIFSGIENSLKYTNHPRVLFETASIKASRPEKDYDIDALLSRVKTLEDIIGGDKTIKVQEEKKEITIEKQSSTEGKPKLHISDEDGNSVKGKLLYALRQGGFEMLWNIMQSVKVEVASDILTLIPKDETDKKIIDTNDNKNRIKEMLDEYLPFEIMVKDVSDKASMEKIDIETEKMKKFFGDDIVIIK